MKAQILPHNSDNITKAASLLKNGRLVAMPTETVYGLAGNVFNESALTNIFNTKERPVFDPLIVHVTGIAPGNPILQLEKMNLIDVKKLSQAAKEKINILISTFWPGPLTLVLPKSPRVPDLATSGLETVALRMPSHPVARALIEAAGTPLAAPSANRFGRISPTSSEDVLSELGDRIEIILDGGQCEIGVESTIINCLPDGTLALLRPGGTPIADIEHAADTQIIRQSAETDSKETSPAVAPGMLASHYSPITPLFLLSEPFPGINEKEINSILSNYPSNASIGILLFEKTHKKALKELYPLEKRNLVIKSLSKSGNVAEASKNLFTSLRYLDQSAATLIISEPCPKKEGLGHAIQDRLNRAAIK